MKKALVAITLLLGACVFPFSTSTKAIVTDHPIKPEILPEVLPVITVKTKRIDSTPSAILPCDSGYEDQSLETVYIGKIDRIVTHLKKK